MGWKIPRLSRRAFLKTTGYGTAGLSLLSPVSNMVGKAIAKEYQGELNKEAIAAFAAEEYGWEPSTVENPAQPVIDAGNARLEQVQQSTESLEPATIQEQARKAAAEGDMVAAANAKAALLRAKFK